MAERTGLTVAQLAAQRGLSLKAAWNLVQREGWCWTESAVRGVVVSVPKENQNERKGK